MIAVLCVLVDFFFALFPWLFIWSLRMNKREKIVILLSLSLGVMYALLQHTPGIQVHEILLTAIEPGLVGSRGHSRYQSYQVRIT